MKVKDRVVRMLVMAAGLLPFCALPQTTHAQDKDDAASRYAATPAVSYPGGVQNFRDVTFAELTGFRPLTLDLYVPPAAGKPKPVVVFVHGGAWRHRTARDGGTFRDFPAVLASMAARGYVVASVNYRFVGEARFPGPVQDVATAIRWLRTHASEYNIDPARFALWGSSAGGQIAALIGTGCEAPVVEPPASAKTEVSAAVAGGKAAQPLPSVCVQGVIDWYGLVDLEHHAGDLGAALTANKDPEAYLGCELSKCPAGLARSASALTYIDSKDPPFLIQHGAADVTVSPKQAQRLYEALRGAGVKAEIVMYPGVSHGFAKVPGGGPDDGVNQQALDKVFEFLAQLFPEK